METKFGSYNGWRITKFGNAEFYICANGRIDRCHITRKYKGETRIKSLMHDEAVEYVEKHGLGDMIKEFIRERDVAISEWKHNTSHFRYNCDGGCLAIRTNGATIKVGNRVGDGNYPVYLIKDDELNGDKPSVTAIPPTFTESNISLGACEFDVMPYDCDDSLSPLATATASKWVSFYTDGHGAVVIMYK